jgi:hypothetical protein
MSRQLQFMTDESVARKLPPLKVPSLSTARQTQPSNVERSKEAESSPPVVERSKVNEPDKDSKATFLQKFKDLLHTFESDLDFDTSQSQSVKKGKLNKPLSPKQIVELEKGQFGAESMRLAGVSLDSSG